MQTIERQHSEDVQRLAEFDGPPAAFLTALLEMQCRRVSALGGATVILSPKKEAKILAACPAELAQQQPAWLQRAIAMLQRHGIPSQTQTLPLEDGKAAILVPTATHASLNAASIFCIESPREAELAMQREQLEWSMILLGGYERRQQMKDMQAQAASLAQTVQVYTETNHADRFRQAGFAFCNAVSSQWKADRISFGLLKGRAVKVMAMSHTEQISRKMTLVQHIESAMEECADQDTEILVPHGPEADYISRNTRELAQQHGPAAIASLPMRKQGEVVGALTLERDPQQPFTANELELLRVLCDMATPRLVQLHERDRWFGAKLAAGLRDAGAWAVGPKHTWAKLGAVAGLAVVLALIFVKGTYRIESPFTIEPTRQRVVPAPFDGFIETVNVEPGDDVVAGESVMATLQTFELVNERARLTSEYHTRVKEAGEARKQGKQVDTQIALAKAEQVQSELAAINRRIEQSRIVAPIGGVVVTGDLDEQIGAPVSRGDVMFEIAPTGELEAILEVPDSRVGDLRVGQTGYLAPASNPDKYLAFRVVRIEPVARLENNVNVFRVKAELDRTPDWLSPGMKGLAKVDVGPRSYGYIWTKDVINWIRMQLWI